MNVKGKRRGRLTSQATCVRPRLAKYLVLFHSMGVMTTFGLINLAWGRQENPQLLWLPMVVADLPCSLLLLVRTVWQPVVDKMSSYESLVLVPALILSTLGGLQWYIVGSFVVWIRSSRRGQQWEPRCLGCGYDLRGSIQFRRCPECGLRFSRKFVRQYELWKRTGEGKHE